MWGFLVFLSRQHCDKNKLQRTASMRLLLGHRLAPPKHNDHARRRTLWRGWAGSSPLSRVERGIASTIRWHSFSHKYEYNTKSSRSLLLAIADLFHQSTIKLLAQQSTLCFLGDKLLGISVEYFDYLELVWNIFAVLVFLQNA